MKRDGMRRDLVIGALLQAAAVAVVIGCSAAAVMR